MKKLFLIGLLLFGSVYFCLFTSAQQGGQESQNKPVSSLPTPSINKIVPVEIESKTMQPMPQMVSFRCRVSESVTWGNTSYGDVELEPKVGIKAKEYRAYSSRLAVSG